MQESLPEAAQFEQTAVPSVEDSAPVTQEPVGTDSAQASDGYVEATRFNGLMGRFNRTQNELAREREARAALEAQLQELESRNTAPEGTLTDNSALEAQVSTLTELLMRERLDNARSAAIKEFPEAAAFADLIIADTPDGIRDMAQVLAERVRRANGNEGDPVPQGAAEPPAAETPLTVDEPAPPVVAGGVVAPSNESDPGDKVVDAIKAKSFKSFLAARREQATSDLVLS